MTIYFTIVLMGFVVAAVVLLPLWQTRADAPLGLGKENADGAALWVDQKDRIAGQMSELDVARAEGKIDQKTYDAERARLAIEGERVLKALQGARASRRGAKSTHVARTYPLLGALCGLCFIVVTSTVSVFLGNQVLNRNVSPHADGTVPLPAEAKASAMAQQQAAPGQPKQKTGRAPILGADGQPDIGAMVARLEKRVAKPDAPLKDLMMLARSYRVLGRDDEAITLYERAIALAPNDSSVLMASGQMMSRSEDEAVRTKGENLIDRILSSKPDYPEAMWLKSLGLIRRHKVGEATVMLRRLEPLVSSNPKAKKAVNDLLDRLAQAASTPAMTPDKK